jgi:hypothetical protein
MKHETSDALFWCIKYYIIALTLALVAFHFTRQGEKNAYEAGLERGKLRYWDSFDTALRKKAAEVVEKVEKDNG